MSTERIHPKVVVREPSPNQSARTSKISLIVIHDTESHNREGASDLQAIGDLFARSSFEASAHVCTDGEGQSARYVPDDRKAWHCVSYNSAAVGVEQIGFASQGEWPEAQVKETARWVARWAHRHGVPIRRARTLGGRVLRSGVTTHSTLGSAGGGHTDPGAKYPMSHLLGLARQYKAEVERTT